MSDGYKILAKADLPKEIRREAGKMNIYVGQTFTNKERAQRLINLTLNNPDRYEVVQVYRSSLNPLA